MMISNCNLDAVAPAFFGPIESAVRERDQVGHVEYRITNGDQADRCCCVDIVAIDDNSSLCKTAAQPLRNSKSGLKIGAIQHTSKFLSADPADEVISPQDCGRRFGKLPQYTVPDRMAVPLGA